MKRTRLALLLAALGTLAACAVTEPSSFTDVHTQTSTGTSKEYVASRVMNEVVHAQAFAGTQAGQPIYGLNIRRNAGFSKWAHYNQAFSFGQQLPVLPGPNNVLTCAPFGCDIVEYEQVSLNSQQFQSGLSNGIELRLIGTGATTVISVPAEAFQQAMASIPR